VRALPSGPPELRTLAARFNRMAEQIERQREERLALLVRAGDHLREPLEALRRLADPVPVTDEVALRKRLAREVARLERMLDELVDAVRIEDGGAVLTPTEVDARALAAEAVELIGERSGEHEIELRAAADPLWVSVDVTRVGQVLNNLLSRAVSRMPAGGRVQVLVEAQEGQALIALRADATGPALRLEPLFNAMHRIDRSMRAVPGSLYGLEVARKIVEWHGGTVQVLEETSRAFALDLRLPICRAAPQPADQRRPAAPPP
jgi:signal transduction histidine kinase